MFIQMKHLCLFLIIGISLFHLGCTTSSKSSAKITIQIKSINPSTLINWYTSNLGLKRSPLPNDLVVTGEGFEIEFLKTDVPKQEGQTVGYFKFGFTTNQFDSIYELMQNNGVTFRGEPFYDENLKQRSLVTLDAEGNRVQFFEDPKVENLTANFLAVMTNEFESTKAWYEKGFGFEEQFNLDLAERNITARILTNKDWTLELLSIPSLVKRIDNSPGIVGVNFSKDGKVQEFLIK
jgi:hypothetical protein